MEAQLQFVSDAMMAFAHAIHVCSFVYDICDNIYMSRVCVQINVSHHAIVLVLVYTYQAVVTILRLHVTKSS